MYLEHFQLRDFPFRLTPDGEFFYLSPGHARAKAYLEYTVMSRDGFVVITGEIGAGKTTLLNMMISEYGDQVTLAHINQTQLNDVEFLQAVLSAFGEPIGGLHGKVELLDALRAFLERQASRDRRVVLAVDEAQSLGYEALEQVRMLSGMEQGKNKLMSIVLMGQPELQQVILSPNLEQLAQRIRLRFHLGALSRDETKEYIRHRLRVAGAVSLNLFTEGAYDAIARYAGGIPRLVNSLCDMAMLTAFVEERAQVGAGIVELAAHELEWPPFEERGKGRKPMPGSAMADVQEADAAVPNQQAVYVPPPSTQDEAQGRGDANAGYAALVGPLEKIQREMRGIRLHLAELVGRFGNRF